MRNTPLPTWKNFTLAFLRLGNSLNEVQNSITAHGVNFPFSVVDQTHDCFAGVRKGVYLVGNNTDLTILQRLFFLENTRIGPQDLTVTDVHGKVLKFLHWAEGDGA